MFDTCVAEPGRLDQGRAEVPLDQFPAPRRQADPYLALVRGIARWRNNIGRAD